MPNDAATSMQARAWYWRFSFSAARIAVVSYIAICLILIAMESRLVYHPPPKRDATAEARSLGAEEVWFTSEDQTRLHGWFFPAGNSRRSLVYFHGNGEDAERNLDWAASLRERLQSAVFIFDYRGYGHSEGSAFERGVIMDGIAAVQWLADRMKMQPAEIIFYGRSLGGGVAIAVAEQIGAQGIVVEGTFANMSDVAASRYPFVPVRTLMRNSYLSQERINKCNVPFLQFHGSEDVVVPIELARPLCESAPTEHKRFIEIPGGGHNGDLPEYCYEILTEFVNSLPQ